MLWRALTEIGDVLQGVEDGFAQVDVAILAVSLVPVRVMRQQQGDTTHPNQTCRVALCHQWKKTHEDEKNVMHAFPHQADRYDEQVK